MPFVASTAIFSNTAGSLTSTGSITCAAGELLLISVATGYGGTPPSSVSGGGLTWTEVYDANPTNITTTACLSWFAATSPTAQTFTATVTCTGDASNVVMWQCQRWTGVAVGPTKWGSAQQSTGQVTLTPTQANSALVWALSDYNCVGGTRTYNTATAGAATETAYQVNAFETFIAAYYANAGAVGSKTIGTSVPSGQIAAVGVLELVPSSIGGVKVGSTTVAAAYVGSTAVSAMYVGSTKIFP